MEVQFATCNRKTALKYIRKVLPDQELEDTPESLGPLLDLVEEDVIRVQDPMMYGSRIGIIPSENWDESRRGDVVRAAEIIADAA